MNLVAEAYNNPVRAGYSFGMAELLNGAPRAASDDNANMFDPFPFGHAGEVNDRDFFDSAGGPLSFEGATINSPERAILTNPAPGTYYLVVDANEVYKPDHYELFMNLE